jgi:hypothetical protein
VDPKAEAFYGWSGYNSNLDNPILNKDPLGDIVHPVLAAGIAAFIVDGVMQVGNNLRNGDPAFKNYSLASGLISAGSAMLTVATITMLPVTLTVAESVAVGSGVSGVGGALESATKQIVSPDKNDDGTYEKFSGQKVVVDGVVAAATAGHAELGEAMYKTVVSGVKEEAMGGAIINLTGEINENVCQAIASATIAESKPKPKPNASTKQNPNTNKQPTGGRSVSIGGGTYISED